VRVGAAPAPLPRGLASWSDIGSLRSPPAHGETSSLVHVRTGGAGRMVLSAWASPLAWPSNCLPCRLLRDDCKDDSRAKHKPCQRYNLRDVGSLESHASPLRTLVLEGRVLILSSAPALSVVPIARVRRAARAFFPKNASVPSAILTLLPSLLIERDKRLHHVVKLNRTLAARPASQAGSHLDRACVGRP
jgi:hypothetical protein